jgi:16S rRNA (cytosine967-C5)-methyltransferase
VPPGNSGATAARRAAIHTLEGCARGRIFEHALDEAARNLDDRDRRLAHELAAGVLRRQSALDARLAPLVSRDWGLVPPRLRAILRLGAYQLTALDRVPAHAAVATSVALAREASGARAAGFVNAVLRRLAADPALKVPVLSPDLERTNSHPPWLVDRWVKRFGPEETRALQEWNDQRPRIAVQPARESLEDLAAGWEREGVAVEQAPFSAGLYVDARRPDQLAGFDRGAFLIQDPAQAMVIRFAGLGGGLVYDACAAPGGKSLALARDGATVVAGDRSRLRVQRIRKNTARAGRSREYPLVADALHPPLRPVDAILLDAPCLGTGTFARHPDARWRVTPEALASLVGQQKAMLDRLASLVKPGGMLVYATCSLEPEENECQVDGFLSSHPEFRREANQEIPGELLSPRGDLTILPQRHRMDGAFAARLRRSAP